MMYGPEPYPSEGAPSRTRVDEAQVRDASVGQLMSQVTDDLSTLMRKEMELAKVEVRAEARKAGRSAGVLGAAGATGHLMLVFASLTAMFALDVVMPIGWAALIITAIYGLVTAVLAARGRRGLRTVSPEPTQTVETLKEDVQWARNRSR